MGFPRDGKSDSTLIFGDQRWIATLFGTISGNELRGLCLGGPKASEGLAPTTVGFWTPCCGWRVPVDVGAICRSGWAIINR